MPTNEERHEVAARLRSLNDNIYHVRKVYDAAGITILCNDQADYYQMCNAVCGYLPAEVMHPCDYKEFHNRLADLIEPEPERTGHLVEREDGSYACSECGASYLCMTDATYCPDCGVRLED